MTVKWTKHNDHSIAGGQPGFAWYTATVNGIEWSASSDERGGWWLVPDDKYAATSRHFSTLRACKAHVAELANG